MLHSELAGKTIIFFDGTCNLCNRSVQFVLKRDRKLIFFYATLNGELAAKLLSREALTSNTVVLLHQGKERLRSSAIIKILSLLGLPWSLSSVFLIIPGFIRDLFYKIVAKYRLQWFGRSDNCWIMQEQWKSRFV